MRLYQQSYQYWANLTWFQHPRVVSVRLYHPIGPSLVQMTDRDWKIPELSFKTPLLSTGDADEFGLFILGFGIWNLEFSPWAYRTSPGRYLPSEPSLPVSSASEDPFRRRCSWQRRIPAEPGRRTRSSPSGTCLWLWRRGSWAESLWGGCWWWSWSAQWWSL